MLGLGTIGLTAIAAARALGAGTIFATARHQHQADMALKLGANAVLGPDGDDLLQAVNETTEGTWSRRSGRGGRSRRHNSAGANRFADAWAE